MQWHAKPMPQMMRPNTCTGSDPIILRSFLLQFCNTCDVNDVHEMAALRLMTHLLPGEPKDNLEDYLDTEGYDAAGEREEAIRSYRDAVAWLLKPKPQRSTSPPPSTRSRT